MPDPAQSPTRLRIDFVSDVALTGACHALAGDGTEAIAYEVVGVIGVDRGNAGIP